MHLSQFATTVLSKWTAPTVRRIPRYENSPRDLDLIPFPRTIPLCKYFSSGTKFD